MKKILIHSELRSGRSGNCLPLDHISILHISSAKKIVPSVSIINASVNSGRLLDDPSDLEALYNLSNSLDNSKSLISICQLSTFADHVVAYIAGFVVKQWHNKLDCDKCKIALKKKSCKNSQLIDVKTRGGLVYPSDDVILICEKTETVLRAAHIESGDKF